MHDIRRTRHRGIIWEGLRVLSESVRELNTVLGLKIFEALRQLPRRRQQEHFVYDASIAFRVQRGDERSGTLPDQPQRSLFVPAFQLIRQLLECARHREVVVATH